MVLQTAVIQDAKHLFSVVEVAAQVSKLREETKTEAASCQKERHQLYALAEQRTNRLIAAITTVITAEMGKVNTTHGKSCRR